jgi:S1-C subfamily serine protease
VPGLLIVELEAGGPAHLSGVLVGDVIVHVDGEPLRSHQQLADAIRSAGNVLGVGVLRAGRLESCEITMARERVTEVA